MIYRIRWKFKSCLVIINYHLPSLYLALLWKPYLGAVGTKHGTREMCKLSGAFLLFFLLGLILVALNIFS
jgi:hypothetical protein